MAIFSGLLRKGLKPQSFNYIPRHYNPMVDDLHQRLKMGKYAETDDALNKKELIKERLRRGMKRNALQSIKSKRKSIFTANLRLLAVLAIIIIVTYYLLVIYLPRVEAWIEGI